MEVDLQPENILELLSKSSEEEPIQTGTLIANAVIGAVLGAFAIALIWMVAVVWFLWMKAVSYLQGKRFDEIYEFITKQQVPKVADVSAASLPIKPTPKASKTMSKGSRLVLSNDSTSFSALEETPAPPKRAESGAVPQISMIKEKKYAACAVVDEEVSSLASVASSTRSPADLIEPVKQAEKIVREDRKLPKRTAKLRGKKKFSPIHEKKEGSIDRRSTDSPEESKSQKSKRVKKCGKKNGRKSQRKKERKLDKGKASLADAAKG